MRRLGCIAIALGLLAGCHDAGDVATAPSGTGAGATPSATGFGTTGPGATAPSTGTGATTGPGTPTATDPPGDGSTTGTPTTGGDDRDAAVRDAALGFVGGFAPAVLRPGASERVVVEVLAQSGAAPRQASIDHLTSVLRSVTAKPVDAPAPEALGGGSQAWTPAAIVAAAAAATQGQSTHQATLRLLFLHGTFQDDDSVLGVSVRGDLAAVFVDVVDGAGTPVVGAPVIEAAVVTHEAGHLLGLVDLYLSTGRQDPQHPGHSRNPQSVMYWAVESDLVTMLLSGGPPRDFDADDLADLAAIRNGA